MIGHYGPLHMNPVDRADSVTRTNFVFSLSEKISPWSSKIKFEKQKQIGARALYRQQIEDFDQRTTLRTRKAGYCKGQILETRDTRVDFFETRSKLF